MEEHYSQIDSIQGILNYVEDHLTEEIDLARLAQMNGFTENTMNILFSSLCGVSLKDYIRRRRLSKAGAELAYKDKVRIIDLAMKYGYESADGFTRAFKAFHGVTPTQFRQTGGQLKAYSPLQLKVIVDGGESQPYRILNCERTCLVGLTTEFAGTPGDSEQESQEIAFLLNEKTREIVNRLFDLAGSDEEQHLIIQRTGQNQYQCSVAVMTDADPMDSRFHKIVVEEGVYLQCHTNCMLYPVLDKQSLRDRMANQWIPDLGYCLDMARPEWYRIHWYMQERKEERYIEVLLPLKINPYVNKVPAL